MTPSWWWPLLNNIREEVSFLLAFNYKARNHEAARQATIAFAMRGQSLASPGRWLCTRRSGRSLQLSKEEPKDKIGEGHRN